MVMLLITLLCALRVAVVVVEVVVTCRGERNTVPVDKVISLFSAAEATCLTAIFGLLPRWMWILLSSVVMILLLLLWPFLMGIGTICFSGVTLKTARPMVISCGSGEGEPSGTIVLTVIIETGDKGLLEAEEDDRLLSGDFALEMVVIDTGDLALSEIWHPKPDFL